MVSLTTVYIVSVLLTSIAGIGSSFAANKMVGGGYAIVPLPVQDEEQPIVDQDYVREEDQPILEQEPVREEVPVPPSSIE